MPPITYTALTICFLVSVVTGVLIIPRILNISYRKGLFDHPDERKEHTQPIPRLGGLAFFPAILISVSLSIAILLKFSSIDVSTGDAYEMLMIVVGLVILYLAGANDDLVGMTWKTKILFQLVAAAMLVLSGNHIVTLAGLFGIHSVPGSVGIPVTMFITVYIINSINFIDGIDGLASGLCGLSLFFLALLLAHSEEWLHALLAVATLGVVIPFWFYNMFGNIQKEHKLFMGDIGSLTLGYILSTLIIHISNMSHAAMVVERNTVLAFSTMCIPLFDVVRVVLVRLRAGQSPFLPDRNHIHHKLRDLGFDTPKVLMSITLMYVFFLVLNILLLYVHIGTTAILVTDLIVWAVMHVCMKFTLK